MQTNTIYARILHVASRLMGLWKSTWTKFNWIQNISELSLQFCSWNIMMNSEACSPERALASAHQNSLYLQHKFWALSLCWTGFRLHTGLYMNIIMWEEIHTVFTWFFFVLGQCLKYCVKCMKGGINFMRV